MYIKKLKVQYVSDLHLESGKKPVINKVGDILVLAGDICVVNGYSNILLQFLDSVCAQFQKVLMVAGNHEYYNSTIKLVDEYLANLQNQYPNFIYMNNKIYKHNDVCFIGTTLWSNIPEKAESAVLSHINDYNQIIDFTINDNNKLHTNAVTFLSKAIDFVRNGDCIPVIITHHTPLVKGTSHPRYANEITNCAFSTNLYHLLDKINGWWICGHTHYCTKIKYKYCNILLNCHGYSNNSGYDSGAHFEIEYDRN